MLDNENNVLLLKSLLKFQIFYDMIKLTGFKLMNGFSMHLMGNGQNVHCMITKNNNLFIHRIFYVFSSFVYA